jgi:hypothetical protein
MGQDSLFHRWVSEKLPHKQVRIRYRLGTATRVGQVKLSHRWVRIDCHRWVREKLSDNQVRINSHTSSTKNCP